MLLGLLPVANDTCGIALAVRSSGRLTICGNACSYGWTRAAREDQPRGSSAISHARCQSAMAYTAWIRITATAGLLVRNKFDELMTTL